MKRILLFALTLTFAVGSMAQLSKDARKYEQKIPRVAVDNPVINPLQPHNNTVASKSTLEDELGQTRYDLQSNESPQNRLYVYPDGTMAGTWTMGMLETGYADRGTGYNYYDGTSWGAAPGARIESVRTGWPSYGPWNGNGEFVIAHNSTTTLVMNTRTTRGTGTWTQSLKPASPSGAPGIAWQRTITSGTTNQNIHVLALTLPVANSGAIYKGLDGALLYWRSTDGGTTWDKNGIQLPGLDSTNYASFGGDEYAWGTPHGDTIYFAVGGPYSDMYLMQSNDNGDNWTKTVILTNANKNLKVVPTYKAPWYSSDGSVACEMGKNGVIHVLSGIGGGEIGNPAASTLYIIQDRNGLIYWNTTMPMLKDSLNLDTLQAHGQLIGWYSDGPNPGDTLVGTPQAYRVGLTSFPCISIADNGDMYVIWSGITWQNPDPSGLGNYRHIWGRGYNYAAQMWTTNQIDFNSDISYIFNEYVYPSMAKNLVNNNFDYIYQTASVPGSAILTTTLATKTCTIEHRQISLGILTGVTNHQAPKNDFVGQNYPNPVNGLTTFNVYLQQDSKVIVNVNNITGQNLMTMDKGTVASGAHQFTIDASQLSTGVYFYTVIINGQSSTHKMIVE
jgi:hypothetical protein